MTQSAPPDGHGLLAQALGHSTLTVPVVQPETTIAQVRQELSHRRYDSVRDVAVCEGAVLVGLLRIEDVLAAEAHLHAGALMDDDPPIVGAGTDQEVAAWKAARHGESSVVVVDEEGRFAGLIPPHRLLAVLLAEHDEDMARLGGFLGSATPARDASEEPVLRRLRHRLPWLLLGLTGAIAAARLVGAFEGVLEAHVAVAFFVPAIVYMADAVGTQTETLLIRGLSLGVPLRHMVRNEVLTGLFIGLAMGTLFVPAGLLLWDEPATVAAVAISLFAACATSTVVAMTLPWALARGGHDPAFGSGPLATVVQDLLSLAIYFVVVVLILG